jgi:hypothetical protein
VTEIRPGLVWLTIEVAAGRVRKKPATIRDWARKGYLTIRLGLIDEHELMLAHRRATEAARERGRRSLQVRAENRNLTVNVEPPRPLPRG